MTAGREMDALVAEKVMGWKVLGRLGEMAPWTFEQDDGTLITWEATSFGSFQPSSDIAAAWTVAERMVKHHGYLFSDAEWDGERSFAEFRLGSTYYGGHADEMPEAICLAALKAVGVDVSSYDGATQPQPARDGGE